MKLFDNVIDAIAARVGESIRKGGAGAAFSDAAKKGASYSVEAMACESLADLMLMQFDLPVVGDNARSRFLDSEAERFKNTLLRSAIVQGFLTGDALVVPLPMSGGVENVIVPSGRWEIFKALGGRLESVVYLVESKMVGGHEFALFQMMSLTGAVGARSCVYTLFASRDGKLAPDGDLLLPEWRDLTPVWRVPNVERLLLGRFRSHVINPLDPNGVKGVPICYGASEPIREIRYLLEQMHNEFGLSEKAVFADKRLFRKCVGADGVERVEVPEGDRRMFKLVSGSRQVDAVPFIHDWAPNIRYDAYLKALDYQERLVEKAIGVSSGILSTPNAENYENVDNVRKSMAKTQAFIDSARDAAEVMLADVVYSWDKLLNFTGAVPMGDYDLMFEWSDEYIDTFSDRQGAILAGEAIGATDAADYRAFVMGETPDVAREAVERIQAARAARSPLIALE